jgi:aldehyde:ferredoxin oxidoreductase
MGMDIRIMIDGKEVTVKEGTTILEAAKSIGITIPTICNKELLEPIGYCRMCSSEIKKGDRTKIVTTCNYPIRPGDAGIEVQTMSDEVKKIRKGLIELMLARWPNVNLIKGYAKVYGVEQPRFTHPLVDESENACILCGRCVRGCNNIMEHHIIEFSNRGFRRQVVMPFEELNTDCLGCGTCVSACPTGAISLSDDPNHPADPKHLHEIGYAHSDEIHQLDDKQNEMHRVGTTFLVTIMNDYDLLPVKNFQFGAHEDAPMMGQEIYRKKFLKGFDGCWAGCAIACSHGVRGFKLKTGPFKDQKVDVDGPEYETIAGLGSNCGIFDPDYVIEANFYCDTYGLDTISVGTTTAFVMECYERGLINDEITEGLQCNFGNQETGLEIIHQMGRGEGFGAHVGKGIRYLKKYFAENTNADEQLMQDIGMECKGLEYSEYVTKESLAQQGGYGMAIKGPQHDEAWLIFLDMVHGFIPTFENKAEALHWFPNFRTWFGLNGLCKLPWNDVTPVDNKETPEPAKVMKHVQWYSEYFSAVTGRQTEPDGIIFMSERVYNLQRLFSKRLGLGTREHDAIPYRSAGPVTNEEYESRAQRYDGQLTELGMDITSKSTDEKVAMLRKHRQEQYEKLINAVYKRRGWTDNGVPTMETLQRLGLDIPEIVNVIKLD